MRSKADKEEGGLDKNLNSDLVNTEKDAVEEIKRSLLRFFKIDKEYDKAKAEAMEE